MYHFSLYSQIENDIEYIDLDLPSDISKSGLPIILDNESYHIKTNERDNYKIIERNDSIGLIKDNSFIISLSNYDKIELQSYGIRVSKNKAYGIYDFKGNLVLPIEYLRIREFMPQIGIYIDLKGNSGLYNLQTGIKSDSTFCNHRITNSKAKNVLISYDCNSFELISLDSMKSVDNKSYFNPQVVRDVFLVKKNDKYGGIDEYGNEIINFQYKDLFLDHKFIIAKSNGKWGIIDASENILIPFEFNQIMPFHTARNYDSIHDKLFIVQKKNKWGIINGPEKELIKIDYDSLIEIEKLYGNVDYLNSQFIVSKNSKYQILDISGKDVLGQEFDYIEQINGTENLKVISDNKTGIISLKNEIIVPTIYDKIETKYRGNRYSVELNNKEGVVDIELGITIEPKYSHITQIEKIGYIVSVTEPEYANGYISYDGKNLLDTIFKSILQVSRYQNGKYVTDLLVRNQADKMAIFDWYGNQVTNFVFDEVEYVDRKNMEVKIGNVTLEINRHGACVKNCPSDDVLKELNIKRIKN
jgi:hypothetical protein